MLHRLPLSIKLALVVAMAVALSTAIVATTVNWAARRNFERYLSIVTTFQTNPVRPLLERHYAEHNSWQGVEAVLVRQMGRQMGFGPRGGIAPGSTHLLLVDPHGEVRYDPTNSQSERMLPRRMLQTGVPLTVDDQTVGYLIIETGIQEDAFQRRLLTTIIQAGAVSAVLAIGLGLVLTRIALNPLVELQAATEQIGAGDLSARVDVQTRDQVGELARRFNSMASELEREDQLRRRLMNDIAHELRTPLTVMQGQLEAMQDGVFPVDKENLQPVYEQTLLLNRLVTDLRDMALAEAGQMALDLAPINPGPMLQRVAARFEPEAEAHRVTLNVKTGHALPRIHADAQRLEQVLGNLLSNALRHTPAGGEINLEARRGGRGLMIIVSDTGEGMAPEDLPHLFERFYRGDRARHRGEGHSGLGLAIARELIRAHGGDITASGAPGQGATFTVDLPVMDEYTSKA